MLRFGRSSEALWTGAAGLSNGVAHLPRSPQVNVGQGKVPLFDGGYRMKKLFLALVAAAALVPTASWAQGFSVGPGGVRVDSGDRRAAGMEIAAGGVGVRIGGAAAA